MPVRAIYCLWFTVWMFLQGSGLYDISFFIFYNDMNHGVFHPLKSIVEVLMWLYLSNHNLLHCIVCKQIIVYLLNV